MHSYLNQKRYRLVDLTSDIGRPDMWEQGSQDELDLKSNPDTDFESIEIACYFSITTMRLKVKPS